MRIALAAVFHLTNTFARNPTTIDDFLIYEVTDSSAEAADPYGVGRLIAALDVAATGAGHRVDRVVTAIGRSGGLITPDTVTELGARLSERLETFDPIPDILLLALSGAARSAGDVSADKSIVAAARTALRPDIPIVALFSPEAQLSSDLIDEVDMPFVVDGTSGDLETLSSRVLSLAERLVSGELQPVSRERRLPLLVPQGARTRGASALASVQRLADEFRGDPAVIDACLIPGFSFADVPNTGARTLVTTNGDGDMAARLAERLRSATWDLREAFVYEPLNVEVVVHEAMLSTVEPVVILDSGDDPAVGGTGDGTGLLWALIDLGAPDAALGVVVDPEVVAAAVAAGPGTALNTDIGGKIDRRAGYPVNVSATVKRIVDDLGDHVGCNALSGRAVLLDVAGRHDGRIDVIVTERAPLSVEPGLFEVLGVHLASKHIVGVKSSGQNAAAYATIASRVLETSTPGITTPSLSYLDYQRVSRPVFPLDDGARTRPE